MPFLGKKTMEELLDKDIILTTKNNLTISGIVEDVFYPEENEAKENSLLIKDNDTEILYEVFESEIKSIEKTC